MIFVKVLVIGICLKPFLKLMTWFRLGDEIFFRERLRSPGWLQPCDILNRIATTLLTAKYSLLEVTFGEIELIL